MPWSAINLPRGCARVVVDCISATISPQNLDETSKIKRGTESTFQDLQFECNDIALAQILLKLCSNEIKMFFLKIAGSQDMA